MLYLPQLGRIYLEGRCTWIRELHQRAIIVLNNDCLCIATVARSAISNAPRVGQPRASSPGTWAPSSLGFFLDCGLNDLQSLQRVRSTWRSFRTRQRWKLWGGGKMLSDELGGIIELLWHWSALEDDI